MQNRLLNICLILVLFLAIIPEIDFVHENTCSNSEINPAVSEETNSCDEHDCPIFPEESFHHCVVCCAVSHLYIDQLTGIFLHFNNIPQSHFMDMECPHFMYHIQLSNHRLLMNCILKVEA